MLTSPPGADDPDQRVRLALAMAYHQNTGTSAHADQDEALLVPGLVRIIEQQAMLVEEDGLSLLKGDTMLAAIGLSLPKIPGEP